MLLFLLCTRSICLADLLFLLAAFLHVSAREAGKISKRKLEAKCARLPKGRGKAQKRVRVKGSRQVDETERETGSGGGGAS